MLYIHILKHTHTRAILQIHTKSIYKNIQLNEEYFIDWSVQFFE